MMESISTSLTTLFTNFDTALRDDAPTHRLPLADVIDDDRLLGDLILPNVEDLLLAKSLSDDLLPRLPDRPSSTECLKPDLSVPDPTDAYDLVTLDELPDNLPDLDLLAEFSDDLLDLELAALLDLDLLDELPDELSDDLLDLDFLTKSIDDLPVLELADLLDLALPDGLPDDLLALNSPSELALSDFILSSHDNTLLDDQDAPDLLDDEALDLFLDDSSALPSEEAVLDLLPCEPDDIGVLRSDDEDPNLESIS